MVGRSMQVGIAVASALAVIGAGGFLLSKNGNADPEKNGLTVAGKPLAPLGEQTAVLTQMENGFSAIAERMEPSVVSIAVTKTMQGSAGASGFEELFRQFGGPGGGGGQGSPEPFLRRGTPRTFRSQGAGSGVIVQSDGWILTNDHVVGGADKVKVKLHDGRELDGTVRRDFRSDLAMVKVAATGLQAVEFADSSKIRVGQWAIAFGSPFQLDDTMTVGIISARSRQNAISDGGETRFYPSLLQTDASINPGNSGGPLVDVRGKIIGINVAINSPTGASVGIGFAIPANTAKNVMEQLIQSGKVTRGFLGVAPRALTGVERTRYGVASGGALVESVSQDTPAAKAGLQVEDVVTAIDGKQIADDVEFRDAIARVKPGTTVKLNLRRNGKQMTLNATLGSAPETGGPGASPEKAPASESGKLGIAVEPVSPANSKQYNLEGVSSGLVVVQVSGEGPAAQAGIQPGDVILRAVGRDLKSGADLKGAVDSAKSGDKIALVVQRGKTRMLVSVEMP